MQARKDRYGSDEDVPRQALIPGVRVRRYTDSTSSDSVDVSVPCCGRRARLPIQPTRETVVACPFCSLVFRAVLIDENDGGYAAILTVSNQTFVLARRRRSA